MGFMPCSVTVIWASPCFVHAIRYVVGVFWVSPIKRIPSLPFQITAILPNTLWKTFLEIPYGIIQMTCKSNRRTRRLILLIIKYTFGELKFATILIIYEIIAQILIFGSFFAPTYAFRFQCFSTGFRYAYTKSSSDIHKILEYFYHSDTTLIKFAYKCA